MLFNALCAVVKSTTANGVAVYRCLQALRACRAATAQAAQQHHQTTSSVGPQRMVQCTWPL